jgi:hypothetical protein
MIFKTLSISNRRAEAGGPLPGTPGRNVDLLSLSYHRDHRDSLP